MRTRPWGYALSVVLAFVAVAGCGSGPKHAASESQGPPPEALRPSPVDRDAEPPPAMFDWAHHLGVAGRDARGRACVAINDDSLTAGSPLVLVWMTDPQQVSEARVLASRAKPWTIANTPLDGRTYDMELTGGAPAQEGFAIAVVGPVQPGGSEGGLACIDLDGDGEAETFRQCSSAEGLHLTVWTGEPLKGPLDWQRYVYMGMDLEVTCTETETGQP